jgi:catalase
MEELAARLATAPIKMNIWVQIADAGDVVDDATVSWPAERRRVLLGSATLNAFVPENAAAQQQIIFDPIPRLEGIEPSADPLLEPRADAYLLSGRRRRSAGK